MADFINIFRPSDQLSPFIDYFWRGSINSSATNTLSLQMVPHGRIELIIHLNDLHCELVDENGWSQTPDYMLIGLITRPMPVRFVGRVEVFSIRFKPDGLYNIFGVPASLFLERFEDMSLVLPLDFKEFCHRMREGITIDDLIILAERYLVKCLNKHKNSFTYVNKAAQLIRSSYDIKIEEVTDQVFISQRQLERGFKDKMGISPKHYLRISRINEVLKLLSTKPHFDLTSIAYHCGYFDQAHFIKDFRSITGVSPSVFMKKKHEFLVTAV